MHLPWARSWSPALLVLVITAPQQNRYTQCSFFSVASECPTDAIPGTPARPGFMGSALSVPGDNFFAVKMSYWLAL